MSLPLRIRVVGVHPFVPSDVLFEETLEALYGSDLSSTEAELVRPQVNEHFDGLYVVQIEVDPPRAEFDWWKITQPVAGSPRSNWQVPYDEQPLDAEGKRWAFFFHFLDLRRRLLTPCGSVLLPSVTPLPQHLSKIEYSAP